MAAVQLPKQIKALMRRAELLDAQEDGQVGKVNLGNDLTVNAPSKQQMQNRR